MKISCVFCSQTFSTLRFLKIGEVLTCSHCQAKQEVVWMFPLELIPVPNQLSLEGEDIDQKEHHSLDEKPIGKPDKP